MTDYSSTLFITDDAASEAYEARIWPFALVIPDATPPIISFSPVGGSAVDHDEHVVIDVTDETGIASVSILWNEYGVWDGVEFVGAFAVYSTAAPIAGGTRFDLILPGGWDAAFTLRVVVTDTGGNVTTEEASFTIAEAIDPPPPVEDPTGPPVLLSAAPGIVDVDGGTVVLLSGANFTWPMTIELLLDAVVVGTAVVADERYDLTKSTVHVGLPALAAGVYDIRVTTDYGNSLLEDAVEYRVFAEELKVELVRSKWGRAWKLGTRMLTR